MTECRPRPSGRAVKGPKEKHTTAAGAGLRAGKRHSSRCGWWCAHMKGYYERTKKKKPVDRAGALIYGRLISDYPVQSVHAPQFIDYVWVSRARASGLAG